MSLFDQAYDEMSWKEVCYRLPSELAVNALKRRIISLDTLKMFFENIGHQPSNINVLKEHVNNIILNESVDNILNSFNEDFHPTLFNWLSSDNIKRIKEHNPDGLSIKLLYNLTEASDKDGMKKIFRRVLDDGNVSENKVLSVLRKADNECIPSLVDMLLKDDRPNIRACVLSIPGLINNELISDHQKIIGLKALTKCDRSYRPLSYINKLSINVFKSLRPRERIDALNIYLNYFPLYKKSEVFIPNPTEEEFQTILFSGCIEFNDEIVKINDLYNKITKEDSSNDNETSDDI
jgi:hypothetical protein